MDALTAARQTLALLERVDRVHSGPSSETTGPLREAVALMERMRQEEEAHMDSPGCSFCGGSFHPATGCSYTENFRACRNCTVEFWQWFRQRLNSRPRRRSDGTRGPSFYDHVR